MLLLLLIYLWKQNLRHFTNIKKTFLSQRFTAKRYKQVHHLNNKQNAKIAEVYTWPLQHVPAELEAFGFQTRH